MLSSLLQLSVTLGTDSSSSGSGNDSSSGSSSGPFLPPADGGESYFGISRHVWAWAIGTGFSLTALLLSLVLIHQTHLHNRYPTLRRCVLLVLWMIPVYAVFAWLGLVLKDQSAYWDVLRQCYESVAIYAFFQFLTAYLGGPQHMAAVLESKGDRMPHLFPLCFLPQWRMHQEFYKYSRLLVVQYIPVQFICAILIFITSLTGLYHDGLFSFTDAYIYLSFTINCSQVLALYGLVELYHALRKDLVATRPFLKFLCIKGVVFFTFWQSVFLGGLVATNVITPTITYTTSQETYGIDDFVICIEMLGFVVLHWFAYPPREFSVYAPPPNSLSVSRPQGASTCVEADGMDAITYALSEQTVKQTPIDVMELQKAKTGLGGVQLQRVITAALFFTAGEEDSTAAAGGSEVRDARVSSADEADGCCHSGDDAVAASAPSATAACGGGARPV